MAAAGAAAAAMIQAVKASGVIVRLGPEEFSNLMNRAVDPLIVIAQGGLFTKNYQYLMSYKGLAFFAKSDVPLRIPEAAEVVTAGAIWIPG